MTTNNVAVESLTSDVEFRHLFVSLRFPNIVEPRERAT